MFDYLEFSIDQKDEANNEYARRRMKLIQQEKEYVARQKDNIVEIDSKRRATRRIIKKGDSIKDKIAKTLANKVDDKLVLENQQQEEEKYNDNSYNYDNQDQQ